MKKYIRLAVNKKTDELFEILKKKYVLMDEPELIKLGLSKLAYEDDEWFRLSASAKSFGVYDKNELEYNHDMGKKLVIGK